jgi:hypothetical protein
MVEINRGHGRIEQREYWWCASGELETYLAEEYGWSGVPVCGRVRRKRRPLYTGELSPFSYAICTKVLYTFKKKPHCTECYH